jgi:hypothetical protein
MQALTLPLLKQWAPPSPQMGEGLKPQDLSLSRFGEREGPAGRRPVGG